MITHVLLHEIKLIQKCMIVRRGHGCVTVKYANIFYICFCIITLVLMVLFLQHEFATRSVDNNIWEEIRNFKKCLLMMFAEQDREVIFLETVMGLAQQHRHCLVECIPLPREIAKQAPLYFKKVCIFVYKNQGLSFDIV